MAKIKNRLLQWQPAESPQVTGYKLYWAEGSEVDYDSECAEIGNVTEILLPEDVPSFPVVRGSIAIGITATDELGNESEMIKIKAPYQFSVPDAPRGLVLQKAAGHHVYSEKASRYDEEEDVAKEIEETLEGELALYITNPTRSDGQR
jgi:hypothetical protein